MREGSDVMDWILTVIGAVSALAAWIALILSFQSSRTAKKSHLLALKQEQRIMPSLELYLVDSRMLCMPNDDSRIFAFHIMVTNKSYAGNSDLPPLTGPV